MDLPGVNAGGKSEDEFSHNSSNVDSNIEANRSFEKGSTVLFRTPGHGYNVVQDGNHKLVLASNPYEVRFFDF